MLHHQHFQKRRSLPVMKLHDLVISNPVYVPPFLQHFLSVLESKAVVLTGTQTASAFACQIESKHEPIVTRTENNPLATLSVTSSISASVALGSFSFSYVLLSEDASLVPAATEAVEKVGVWRDGERENRLGDRTKKSRC